MYLKQHLGLKSALLQFLVYTNHGYLDNVCRTTLYRSVNGVPFRRTPNYGVTAIDVLEVSPSAQNRLNITILPRKFNLVMNIVAEFGVRRQIPRK